MPGGILITPILYYLPQNFHNLFIFLIIQALIYLFEMNKKQNNWFGLELVDGNLFWFAFKTVKPK